MQNFVTVTDAQAVKLCLNREYARVLQALMLRPSQVKPLSDALGLPLNATHHRVTKLVGAGLLEVTAEVARGRPVKTYRATATSYFIPFTATTLATPLEFWLAFSAPMDERINLAISHAGAPLVGDITRAGIRFDHQGRSVSTNVTLDGELFDLDSLEDDDQPTITAQWDRLALHPEDAKELQREMNALLGRYQKRGGKEKFLIRLTLTPDLPDAPPL